MAGDIRVKRILFGSKPKLLSLQQSPIKNSRVCFRWDITSKSGYVSISNIRKFNLIYQRNFTQSIVAKWSGKEIVNLYLYVIPVIFTLGTSASCSYITPKAKCHIHIHPPHVERLLLHIAKNGISIGSQTRLTSMKS